MLIGLTGPAQSGKDTAAQHLRARHGFRQIAFADPLRAMLMAAFALTSADFEPGRKEEVLPEVGKSPRQLMQSLGTEWGRQLVHPDVWVRLAEDTILAECVTNGRSVVVSDVRMENEADMIRKRGGIVIHLHRAAARRVNPHSSERGIAVHGGDIEVFNNGRPEAMFEQLDAIVLAALESAEAQA